MDIRLTRCQIGLFGYPNKKGWIEAGVKDLPVADSFVAALNAKAGANKCISCIELWDLAGAHKISRMQAGYLADKLGLQIMDCQLGAF